MDDLTLLRDKMYVLADDGMLFNVTGYEHPRDAVFASLKYIGTEKWTRGYAAARAFLCKEYPDYVGQYIQVPQERIVKVFDPCVRWKQLLESATLSPLHRVAIEIAEHASELLGIDLQEFAITDSLLWGDGHAASDVDLLVVGLANAERLVRRSSEIYTHPGFERPDPKRMTAPYGLQVENWRNLLARKQHMGCYRGRLFSLRAMLDAEEFALLPSRADTLSESKQTQVKFQVADVRESLLFPAVYRNPEGDELVDYSVVYEGVFRVGDVVECLATAHEMSNRLNDRTRSRFVLEEVHSFG